MASKRRSEIRFLFGDEERVVTDVDPTFTVLDWLRTVEGKMGTKEAAPVRCWWGAGTTTACAMSR